MGIYLGDHDHDCLTNLRFADDVMLFATFKEQIRKMMCDFKKATEKVGLRIHPDKTKIFSNQSTINSDIKKHIEVGDMSIEILTRNESVKYLGQRNSFYHQYTIEIKSRIRAAWATSTNTDKSWHQKITCSQSSTAFRRHSYSDCLLRCGNLGTKQRTRENDSIDTTQGCYDSLSRRKGNTKRFEKQDIEPKEENGKVDITEMCSTDNESGDGHTKTQDDVDSEVSFEDDPDEENGYNYD